MAVFPIARDSRVFLVPILIAGAVAALAQGSSVPWPPIPNGLQVAAVSPWQPNHMGCGPLGQGVSLPNFVVALSHAFSTEAGCNRRLGIWGGIDLGWPWR